MHSLQIITLAQLKAFLSLPVKTVMLASLLLFSACSYQQKQDRVSLVFTPTFGGEALNCNLVFMHNQSTWRVNTLGLFISNIEIATTEQQSQEDKWQPLSFQENEWQTPNTALLWFSASQEQSCEGAGSLQSNSTLTLLAQQHTIKTASKLRFTMAVPFKNNHNNPLTQASPLNNPEMFWSWRNGHKFMRADLSSSGNEDWSFHLGSLGCSSASSLRPPTKECLKPNRFAFELAINESDMADENMNVEINLDKMLKGLDITSMTSCMFNIQEEKSCQMLLTNLQNEALFSLSGKR